MKFTIKKAEIESVLMILIAAIIISSSLIGVSLISTHVSGANNITNQTVLAIVNITNTEPNITAIVVDDNDTDTPFQIDLTANNITTVHCNITVFDYNGWQDINASSVNATLYIESEGSQGSPDNNFRYRNDSCNSCVQGDTANTAECVCQFSFEYYANDSATWYCNASLSDNGGQTAASEAIPLNDSDISDTAATVTRLLAIDTGDLIDYGNLSVTQTSSEQIHNVTNVGNTDLNITLHGYGGYEDYTNENYTMVCGFGNITFDQQRYEFGSDLVGSTVFADMLNLSNQTRNVVNSTLPQRIDDTNYGWDRNSTIWRLQVPLSVGGFCNGTIIFGAIES